MIALIASVARNNSIGKGGKLVWYEPEDLKRFKKLTTGHVVVMGRKTWESLMTYRKDPLPNRTNVVISHNAKYQLPDGVELFTDLDAALKKHAVENVFIIGGAQLFRQTIDRADQLYITHIDQDFPGDAFFPEIDPAKWRVVKHEPRAGFEFVDYVSSGPSLEQS